MGLSGGLAANGGVSGATELGYAQITSSSATVTSASATAITGLSTTVTVGNRPIRIEGFAYGLGNVTTAWVVGHVGLFEDGTKIAQADINLPAAEQFGGASFAVIARRAPAAGSHTYSISIWSDGTNGVFIEAAANAPAFVHVCGV